MGEWEDEYAYGRDDKLGLKALSCIAYGSIPAFVPKDSHSVARFEEYCHDIGGGTVALAMTPERITKEVNDLAEKAKEDIEKLEKILGPLVINWGLLAQHG